MFTFEKKLKKLQELAPEYAKNLLTEDQKDAFEETALTWGYTVEELIEPYYKTVTFTDLAAETKMNNQLITMYQQEIQTMTIMYDNEVMVSSQGMYNNKKSNFAGEDVYYGPANKMSIPCESCPLAATCGYECKAFTQWIDEGVYWDKTAMDWKKEAVKDKNGKVIMIKVKGKMKKKMIDVQYERVCEVGVFKPNPKKVA